MPQVPPVTHEFDCPKFDPSGLGDCLFKCGASWQLADSHSAHADFATMLASWQLAPRWMMTKATVAELHGGVHAKNLSKNYSEIVSRKALAAGGSETTRG